MAARRAAVETTVADTREPEHRNEVALRGRLPAAAEERTLPSGDVIVTFRIVVTRTASRRAQQASVPADRRRATVDTIDVVCWRTAAQRAARRLAPGDVVEVEGALRRRFFGGPNGRQSRHEVEAARVRRGSGAGRGAS
jgi:single-strand DNA-binding protein